MRRVAPLVVVVLLASSCFLAGDGLPSAAEAADSFLDAWQERDTGAMADMSAAASPAPIEAAFDAVIEQGRITSFTVRRSGAVVQPEAGSEDPVTTSVPYKITYASDASDSGIVLEGSLQMVLVREPEAWKVVWKPAAMLPGIDGAVGLDVRYRPLARGRIVDRNGKILADGTGTDRTYPYGTTGGMVVGHLGRLTKKQAKEALSEAGAGAPEPDPRTPVGASGLEEAYERELAGRPASRVLALDPQGRKVELLGRAAGQRGRRVRATVDIRVQRAAERAFGSTTGGAVVLDPGSGDLLAAVGGPFDPNRYVGVKRIDPFNRALSGLYPPGSSLKVMTAAAALDAGTVEPKTKVSGPVEYRGVRNFESESFGTISVAAALQNSVNTAFAQIAEDVGGRRLTRYARRFGFNRPPDMRLDAATSSFPRPQDGGDLMWGAIGQAQVLATPLQMATVAATVANRGTRMAPRAAFRQPETSSNVVKPRTARQMRRLMERVVQRGTGTGARVPGVRVAGKTGTAEVDTAEGRKNHAWFIAFAPAHRPKVAVAVVSEYGGVGGRVAAPLAGKIIRAVLPLVR